MKSSFFYFVLFFLSSLVYSAEEKRLIFVGEAYGEKDMSILKEEAMQDVFRKISFEYFGVVVKNQEKYINKNAGDEAFSKVDIYYPKIKFKSLKVLDSSFEKNKYVLTVSVKQDEIKAIFDQLHQHEEIKVFDTSSFGFLNVVVYPTDALITINELPVNTLQNIKLTTGVKHRLKIQHQNYLSQEVEVFFNRHSTQDLEVRLVSLPTQFVFESEIKQFPLSINGQQFLSDVPISLVEGSYLLEVNAIGYEPFSETIKVVYSEKVQRINLPLKRKVYSEEQKNIEFSLLHQSPIYSSIAPFNLGFNLRLERDEVGFSGNLSKGIEFKFNWRYFLLIGERYFFGTGLHIGIYEYVYHDPIDRVDRVYQAWPLGANLIFRWRFTSDFNAQLVYGMAIADYVPDKSKVSKVGSFDLVWFF